MNCSLARLYITRLGLQLVHIKNRVTVDSIKRHHTTLKTIVSDPFKSTFPKELT
jgi:hypothetical protein